MLDLAAATYLALPDNRFNDAEPGGVGAWLTAGYVWTSHESVLVLARYIARELETHASSSALHLGLKGHYAWDRFAAGADGIGRVAVSGEEDDDFS